MSKSTKTEKRISPFFMNWSKSVFDYEHKLNWNPADFGATTSVNQNLKQSHCYFYADGWPSPTGGHQKMLSSAATTSHIFVLMAVHKAIHVPVTMEPRLYLFANMQRMTNALSLFLSLDRFLCAFAKKIIIILNNFWRCANEHQSVKLQLFGERSFIVYIRTNRQRPQFFTVI